MPPPRILIAGIGNIFLGDDAFGVEVVRRFDPRTFPPSVRVVDFGIRGFDLACALVDGYDAALLVDAAPRGGAPGTLYVIEPLLSQAAPSPELLQGHGLHPARVLQLAGSLGTVCPWVRIVGCEPLTLGSEDDPIDGLSAPVAAAVDEAVRLIGELVRNLLDGRG